MPQPKRYANHAQRQAAYRSRRDEDVRAQIAQKGLPSLPAISSVPGDRRWRTAIGQAVQLIENVATEMQEYFDERSEAWQDGERAAVFEERRDALAEPLDLLAQWLTE